MPSVLVRQPRMSMLCHCTFLESILSSACDKRLVKLDALLAEYGIQALKGRRVAKEGL